MEIETFKKIVYTLSENLGCKVNAIYETQITPNFHAAELNISSNKIYLLCSIEGNWALSDIFEPGVCKLKFVDNSALSSALFKTFGISIKTKQFLNSRFEDVINSQNGDVKYWKPKTNGDFLFNWWD
jgi:hypothetical protein